MKLFPAFDSCEDSVHYAINMLQALKNGSTVLDKGNIKPMEKHLSMEEVLAFKDIQGTLNIRENLRKKILGT